MGPMPDGRGGSDGPIRRRSAHEPRKLEVRTCPIRRHIAHYFIKQLWAIAGRPPDRLLYRLDCTTLSTVPARWHVPCIQPCGT